MADIDKFTYDTLTINGITKICDDKIYVHNKNVINYQWHKFQLIYILETLLKESIIDDITGLELPKWEICDIIIIAGLDGDSNREPFGQILECIPLCDEVVKLNAMDMVSNDGTPAIFTKRIVPDESQICIGAKGDYIAVSRVNYLNEK